MQTIITEKVFSEILQEKLGDLYTRAKTVFENFGSILSYDVTNALLHAVDYQKVAEVLAILESHFDEHLEYQHPKIRGTVSNCLGINETEKMFIELYQKTFSLMANK